MADPRGFLNIEQQKPIPRPVFHRIKDYNEVYNLLPAEGTRAQASRCMDCGVPFCHTGCPLGNLIPDWNDLVHRNRWSGGSFRVLHATNNFPGVHRQDLPRSLPNRRASWPSTNRRHDQEH